MHATPFVKLLVTLLAVVLAPKITFIVPVNEQKPFSDAHLVHEVVAGAEVVVLVLVVEPVVELVLEPLDVPLAYQQLFE
ncbi:MAG TPA: hypothetical protein VKS80_02450 [Trinickia sp.]|nr:hypothetical protein [Trinickia sp.]